MGCPRLILPCSRRPYFAPAGIAPDHVDMPRFHFSPLCCAALALLGCTTAARIPEANGPELAITMDDLPVHGALPPGETRLGVAQKILAAFKAAGVPEV